MMRRSLATTILSLALGLALAGASCRKPPAVEPPVAPPTGPGLEAPPELSLGRTVAGTRAAGELTVKATRPVRVLSVESSCECTTASAVELPRDLRAGESLAIAVEIDLAKVGRGGLPKEGEPGPGRVRREVIVKTNQGEVRSGVSVDVSDGVLVEPAALSFATIARGKTARGQVRVIPTGANTSVAVLSAETNEPGLVATTAPDGNGARVDLAWTPPEAGDRVAEVKLTLDRPDDPFVVVRAAATVVAPVTVFPTSIENLAAPMTRPVVATLTVRRLDEEPLDLKSVAADNHRVTLTVQPGSGATRTVQVLIPVLPLPAEMAGTVTIVTGVPGGERLTVPFRVKAAGPG